MVFVFYHPPSHPLACFLIQVFLTLIITRAIGKVLGYVKQPRVIGEIIGGIVLGPSVLGQIPNFTKLIFPQFEDSKYFTNGTKYPITITEPTALKSLDTFGVVANMGLIFFMFLMGLELELDIVKKIWKQSVPISAASIIFPFALGAVFSLWWTDINNENNSKDWKDPDFTAFLLFCGTCLSFTAFPVLCSILKSAHMIKTPLGALTLSCAAINDVVAWCILAIASSFSKNGDASDGAYTVALAVAFVIAVFLIVQPLVNLTYRRFRTKGDVADSGLFSSIMILMLLVVSFTSEVIGIHAFFGAFLAGMIVPKKGELPQQLAPKIELVVRELLLPLFFANSGLRTNVGSLDEGKYWGYTVIIIIIATFAKVFPAYLFTKLIVKETHRFSLTVGILMNTRGLVELIALNVALQFGILSPRFFTILVFMAIITTAMTAPAMWYTWLRDNRQGTDGLEPENDANYLSPTLDGDFDGNSSWIEDDNVVGGPAHKAPDAVPAEKMLVVQNTVAVSTL